MDHEDVRALERARTSLIERRQTRHAAICAIERAIAALDRLAAGETEPRRPGRASQSRYQEAILDAIRDHEGPFYSWDLVPRVEHHPVMRGSIVNARTVVTTCYRLARTGALVARGKGWYQRAGTAPQPDHTVDTLAPTHPAQSGAAPCRPGESDVTT